MALAKDTEKPLEQMSDPRQRHSYKKRTSQFRENKIGHIQLQSWGTRTM